jgi:hypothetical protein
MAFVFQPPIFMTMSSGTPASTRFIAALQRKSTPSQGEDYGFDSSPGYQFSRKFSDPM